MSESATPNSKAPPADAERQTGPQSSPHADEAGDSRKSFVKGAVGYFRQMARDAISVATGQVIEEEIAAQKAAAKHAAQEAGKEAGDKAAKSEDNERKLGMLHGVAERLRGAADSYIAAKLDEIEARVDSKLDNIEERIDEKIARLNTQLAELRDQELKHRLRILKITLVFTVIVAAISLGYRWLTSLAA